MPEANKGKIWRGKNKSKIRTKKIKHILDLYKEGSYIVTLPGSMCLEEKELEKNNFDLSKVIGIQEVVKRGTINGEEVYKQILKIKNKENWDLNVWPGSASSFFKCLSNRHFNLYRKHLGNKQLKLLPAMHFNKMNNVVLSSVDLDLCGIISANLFSLIEDVFGGNSLTDHCQLFVNVQKGRDVRWGRLFTAFEKYGYKLVGWELDPYSDKNSANIGVTMLQFRFEFRRT